MKIMIVDDQMENRKLLHNILSPYGSCDLAANGTEALELFEDALNEQQPYNLILLDIMMPGIDGQEVLKRMRHHEQVCGRTGLQESKILMVSALDSPTAVVESFFKGYCTDYLVKPVKREQILEKMRNFGLI